MEKGFIVGLIASIVVLWVHLALKKKYILGSLWGKNHHFLVSGRPGCDETTFIKTSTTHQVDQNVTKGVGSLKLGGGNKNSEKIFL